MNALHDRLTADLVTATKGRRDPDRMVLRALLAAIRNEEIKQGQNLDEAGLIKVLQKELKQRREAAAAAAERPELAADETAEAVIIERYLPAPLTDEELSELVDQVIAEAGATNPADLGRVMGILSTRAAGRADGGRLAEAAKARLTK